jgi:hypothetical protein
MGMEAALDGGAGDCLITGYRCTHTAPNNAPPSARPPRVPAATRISLLLRERRKHGRSSGVRPLGGQAAVGLLLPKSQVIGALGLGLRGVLLTPVRRCQGPLPADLAR